MMKDLEEKVPYLLKMKLTGKVKQPIKQVFSSEEWTAAGQGWKGVEAELELTGCSHKRRMIVLRWASAAIWH
jgi:hypothetical protein